MGNDSADTRKRIHALLQQYWGFQQFRPGQEEIITQILKGKDVLALMPTGGGKSLCYQLPTLVFGGLCLVISPLIALMKDQVENLRKKGITAFAIWSGMSRKEVIQTLQVAAASNCRFLYVSPERLETALFKEYLPALDIRLIAVDEAHCIAQWGYDFRPPYLRIAGIREEVPGVPVLALTASATPAVQEDICEKLSHPERAGSTPHSATEYPALHSTLHGFYVYRQSFARPNLAYTVTYSESKFNTITDILEQVPGSSIIYCRSRRRTREISDLLQLRGIAADHYHAGLEAAERTRKQEAWVKNQVRVIVCTNAFGMGIDKPDVRSVLHADLPDCLENYYQEAGRAGRDGAFSRAVLLYDEQDLRQLHELAETRFPGTEEIRKVYQAVANYLQVPAGSGSGRYFAFDLPDFLKKFKLPGTTTLYSLKMLEQEGWLSFNEQVFLPSMAGFTTGKEHLYSWEKEHPSLEPLIKTLLRSYEGIFDQPVSISEKMTAALLRITPEAVQEQLRQLDQYGIIEYRPQTDLPQLLFLRDRVRAEEITPDSKAREKRKKEFMARVQQLHNYVQERSRCRSQFIGNYFGDDTLPPCGICDNCLRRKTGPLGRDEFEQLQAEIVTLLRPKALRIQELVQKLGPSKKENAWSVLEHMQAEQVLYMDADGRVGLVR